MDGYLVHAGADGIAAVQHTGECPHRAVLTQAVLDRATAGLMGFDADQHVVLCNRSAAEMLGMTTPKLWRPVPIEQLLGESTKLDTPGRLTLEAALRAGTALAHHDASDTSDRLAKVALLDGRVLHVTVSEAGSHRLAILDIEAAGGLPAERTDGLTGLSDRQWFREHLTELLAAPGRADQVAVLLIDLDRFKAVNDSHGHPVGDALLQVVARRLRSAVRDGDIVSRLGGDEFAVVMSASVEPEAMGARLVNLLSRPYLIEGHVAIIGASVGIAVGPRDGADTPALVRAADLALY